MMNLSELRERARSLSGIRSTAIKPDADVDAILNEAYLELSGLTKWPWLYDEADVAVSASDPVVTIPALRTIEGVLFDGVRLHQVTVADLDEARIDREDDPFAYAILDTTRLLLIPTPKNAGTLRFRGYRQVDGLGESDPPVFDAEFHHVLAYAAAARMLAEEGDDSGRSGFYAQEVQAMVAGMRERYLVAHDSGTFQWGGRKTNRPRWRLR